MTFSIVEEFVGGLGWILMLADKVGLSGLGCTDDEVDD